MTSHRPRVSVSMPVYNGEQYLREALDSLLAQTFEDFELNIGDNGSTDATQAICEAYAARDPRIRYHRSDVNRGAAWNYNRLVELARGPYHRWASYDDLVAPTHLEKSVAILDSRPDVVLAYTKTRIIGEHGETLRDYDDKLSLQSQRPYVRFYEYHKVAMWLMNVAFALMRTATLRQTELIGAYHSSDRILIGELALRGQFYEIPEYLFFRREHPKMSVQANKSAALRALWFDPNNRGRVQMPYWRLFREYMRSINRVPLALHERTLCYARMASWILHPRHMLTISGEAVTALFWPLYEGFHTRRAIQNDMRRNSV